MSSYLHDPFPRFIDRNLIKTIFEVGSRDAKDAVAVADFYDAEKIFIVEPNPDALEICRATISGRGNVKLIEAAASDVPGTLSFYPVVSSHQPDGTETHNIGASSLLKSSGRYGETYVQTEIKVPAVRLDDLCREHMIQSIDLLCMDVQGVEVSVLRSLGSKLWDVKYIITEATVVNQYEGQDQFHNIVEYLVHRGFRLAAVNMENGYWGFGNILFINREIEVPIVGS
ncbi:FkbM family methyltransferase [Methylobacterium sp. WSM2598]|uniref:FkbM family methyltransferase n=1 Tax=Methylobacterium sp. WSM2598 TaxID=398261 RepID=UPI0012F6DF4B|nr:FkbM family methyltransferase [Methylobacterium sp. WSM2598]